MLKKIYCFFSSTRHLMIIIIKTVLKKNRPYNFVSRIEKFPKLKRICLYLFLHLFVCLFVQNLSNLEIQVDDDDGMVFSFSKKKKKLDSNFEVKRIFIWKWSANFIILEGKINNQVDYQSNPKSRLFVVVVVFVISHEIWSNFFVTQAKKKKVFPNSKPKHVLFTRLNQLNIFLFLILVLFVWFGHVFFKIFFGFFFFILFIFFVVSVFFFRNGMGCFKKREWEKNSSQ